MLASALLFLAAPPHFARLELPLTPMLPKAELRDYADLAYNLGQSAEKAKLGRLVSRSFDDSTYYIRLSGTDGVKLAALIKTHLPKYIPPGTTLHIRHDGHPQTISLP